MAELILHISFTSATKIANVTIATAANVGLPATKERALASIDRTDNF